MKPAFFGVGTAALPVDERRRWAMAFLIADESTGRTERLSGRLITLSFCTFGSSTRTPRSSSSSTAIGSSAAFLALPLALRGCESGVFDSPSMTGVRARGGGGGIAAAAATFAGLGRMSRGAGETRGEAFGAELGACGVGSFGLAFGLALGTRAAIAAISEDGIVVRASALSTTTGKVGDAATSDGGGTSAFGLPAVPGAAGIAAGGAAAASAAGWKGDAPRELLRRFFSERASAAGDGVAASPAIIERRALRAERTLSSRGVRPGVREAAGSALSAAGARDSRDAAAAAAAAAMAASGLKPDAGALLALSFSFLAELGALGDFLTAATLGLLGGSATVGASSPSAVYSKRKHRPQMES